MVYGVQSTGQKAQRPERILFTHNTLRRGRRASHRAAKRQESENSAQYVVCVGLFVRPRLWDPHESVPRRTARRPIGKFCVCVCGRCLGGALRRGRRECCWGLRGFGPGPGQNAHRRVFAAGVPIGYQSCDVRSAGDV